MEVVVLRRGLNPDKKSFVFKLLKILLPYREPLAKLQPDTSPACPAPPRLPMPSAPALRVQRATTGWRGRQC